MVQKRKEAGASGHIVAMGSPLKQREEMDVLLLLQEGEIDGLLEIVAVHVLVLVLVMRLLASGHMLVVDDPRDVEQMANGMVGNMLVLGYHLKQAFCCWGYHRFLFAIYAHPHSTTSKQHCKV